MGQYFNFFSPMFLGQGRGGSLLLLSNYFYTNNGDQSFDGAIEDMMLERVFQGYYLSGFDSSEMWLPSPLDQS